jgi:hypothetical protein
LVLSSIVNSLAIEGDGSLIVAGDYTLPNPNEPHYPDTYSIVGRYPPPNSSGSFVYTDKGNGELGLSTQADGKILLIGAGRLARMNPNMTLDTSFADGGQVDLGFEPFGLAVGPDGKFLVDGGAGTNEEKQAEVRFSGDNPLIRFSKRTLSISETSNDDEIHVTRKGSLISVSGNGAGPFLFSAGRVKKLSIDAGAGNDTIILSKSVPTATIDGGDGDDTLIGNRRKDKLTSIEHS